jgi:hypothetical protein
MIYTYGIPIYLIIGIIWGIYTLIRNSFTPKSHREYWFTAGFFSFLLWPILIWTAWGNGFIKEDIQTLRKRYESNFKI